MSILTGIFKPTSGTILINGKNIVTETSKARKNLGLCPQFNIFCSSLNVEENLKFFAGLRNMSLSDIKSNVNEILDYLQLQDVRNVMTEKLSEGMKRKLSIGIAVVGGSKLLVLDEPTSGMDPQSRRVIWETILKLRKGRTILLTTHHMEEADALGDRIAIMTEGSIKCFGSSVFLKKKFGTGYHLHVTKSDICQIDEITKRIKIHIPEANMVSNFDQELIYSLSFSSENFPELFKSLENSYSELGITSCGITVTTMEDVFLNIQKLEDNAPDTFNCYENGYLSEYQEENINLMCSSKLSGIKLTLQQLKSLLIKRFHYTRHNYFLLIFQILLPFCLITVLVLIDILFFSKTKDEAIVLDLKTLFGNTDAFYIKNSENSIIDVLSDNYKKVLESENANIKQTKNATQYFFERTKDLKHYIKKDLVGASFSGNDSEINITSWYNGINYHLESISFNLLTSSLLRFVTEDDKSNIEIINHPFNFQTDLETYIKNDFKSKLSSQFLVSLALTFLSSVFVIFPHHERISKSKLLQKICGINGFIYWMMNFVWDFIIVIVSTILLLLPLIIYNGLQSTIDVNGEAIGFMLIILLLYGWASIPFSYLISHLSKSVFTSFIISILFNLFTGTLLGAMALLFHWTDTTLISQGQEIAYKILKLFPVLSSSLILSDIHEIVMNNILCENFEEGYKICNKKNKTQYFRCCSRKVCEDGCLTRNVDWNRELPEFALPLFIEGVIFFITLIFIEIALSKLLHECIKIFTSIKKSKERESDNISLRKDIDILNEESRVKALYLEHEINNEVLTVKDLTKNYFGSGCTVKELTFSVHKNECFGLLGINGAGKTTVFRMLVGDLIPDSGDFYNNRGGLQKNKNKYLPGIGYCPQSNALINHLTGKETLTLFANLRGVSPQDIDCIVNKTLKFCDLKKYANRTTETYSGGTRRKLSVAIALIGLPEIIILDQPTSGVDPKSCHKLWKILIMIKKLLGESLLLSSHNMNECEALCDRVAIMTKGEFHCLGTIQHLKNKFGQGYTLVVKMKQTDERNQITELKKFIKSAFPTIVLKDSYQDTLQYHLLDESMKLSRIFSFMEEVKQKFSLEDYLVNDTTLEQIFLAFARST
ncbi:ATP-binding cassette sub-family A member 1-like [Centruroides sculpturatus]|uniref:ATP-binding cassette sub-family A member 1-like n=1 Tax=Centruroides sculpturatus TaxID=218467 RepID=UPI000C6E4196|nr:ATP-binding cassette sub-family A member 1-like [Centruroides sculpturatus]XP_023240812.1 ATP-binding cassette sub-family A member 1-like [Centruroides sculpturatus]